MSIYDGTIDTLHTKLTRLLMDNGAAVTKVSIDKLIEFISLRDQSITDRIVRDVEMFKKELDVDTDIIALHERMKSEGNY